MNNKKPGFTIAVASGKGGTGKTFISTNLFNTLQKYSYKVTLVDCDAEEPNARQFTGGKKVSTKLVTQLVPVIDESKCVYCGKCFEYCTYNAIFFVKEARMIRVLDDLCHGCGACTVACEPYGAIHEKEDELGTVNHYEITPGVTVVEARTKVGVHSSVKVVKEAIRSAYDADVVVLDSPPGTSCPFIQTVASADFVVLVTEPTPFGMSDLKQSVETLRHMGKPCGVIVNRAGLGTNEVYDYLSSEQLPLLMNIPFDRSIARIYSEGNLLTEQDDGWQMQFNLMYNLITERYGISCNKW
ncbi:MAG: ATP-binding protein [Paludibacter sp.]|jgi:MinD superfamily P-loop ATPase|nr:ATP-binding protein [Paludibacter sp.]